MWKGLFIYMASTMLTMTTPVVILIPPSANADIFS